jgi:hypothetical protein
MLSKSIMGILNKLCILIMSLFVSINGLAKEALIDDGEYLFKHRFAEQPNMESINLIAIVAGTAITLTNKDRAGVFPLGVIEEGELFWHKGSGQWIIVSSPEDKVAKDVGGCSAGPAVINLDERVYWTC